MSNRSLDDLRAAMQAWYDEASAAVSRNYAYITGRVTEPWRRGSDGTYRRIRFHEYIWASGQDDLKQLPTYATLREAAAASTVVGPLMSHDIGTAIGLSSFNFHGFAMAILPDPEEFRSDQLSSFTSRYNKLTKQLTSEEAEYEVVYFLQNVSFELDRVELEPGLAIQRLTPPEVEQALGDGILRLVFGPVSEYQPMEGAAFGLKRTWRIPRIVGRDITQEQREEIAELLNPRETAEELLQCLALMSGLGIYVAGTMMRRIDDDFSMFATIRMWRPSPAQRVPGNGFRLDASKCSELQQLWRIAHNESFPANKALALAARRLSFAAQRERVEDKLIDILIAAEAFYLTDAGDVKERGELKYRLALRAAVWSENSVAGWDRREVRDHMKRAYDLRSVVAHGGEPKPKDVKVKDQQVSLSEFVRMTEEIVRGALHKAMQQLSSDSDRLSIAWEDLVLPEFSGPEDNREMR
jgi:hypothetical protein